MPSTPSPPPAPDPVATANAQGQMNKETAIAQANLNMVNQNTPTGSLRYQQTGTASDGTPTYTATTSLSPQQQQIFNTTQNLQQNLANIGLQQSQKIGSELNSPFSIPSSVTTPSVYNPTGGPSTYSPVTTPDVYNSVSGPSTYNPVSGPATYDPSAINANHVLGMINNTTHDLSSQILDPVWNARQTALESQLRNQGLAPGSQAYTNAMNDFNNQRNQAYLQSSLGFTQQAQSNVLGALGAEQSGQAQQYGQQAQNIALGAQQQQQQYNQLANNIQLGASQQAQQYGEAANNLALNQAQQQQQYAQQANNAQLGQSQQAQQYAQQQQNNQQAIQNALIERNQPINEVSALLSGSQVAMPQFTNVPQTGIQAPNYEGDVANNYAAQMQGYNAQVANNSAMMGGLFGIPSALLGGWAYGGFKGISDRRLKTDIKRIGSSANGIATYSFRYVFDLSRNVIGYMADEVEKRCPEAVFELNGFKAVDYERAVYA